MTGTISGWALLLAYMMTASALLCGFADYGVVLLQYAGWHLSPVIVATVGCFLAWLVAYKAKTHKNNNTPYTAVSIISLVTFTVPVLLMAMGFKANEVFGWLATVATFGFLIAYLLIVIAGPLSLYRHELLKARHVVIVGVSLVILLLAIEGSVYPVPAYPYNLFPYIFVAWMAVGIVWAAYRLHNPRLVKYIRNDMIANYADIDNSRDKIASEAS